MNNDHLLYMGALRVFHNFGGEGCPDFTIEHDLSHPGLNVLRSTYSIDEIAVGEGSFRKAVRLMRWVHDHLAHNGGPKDVEHVEKDALSILAYAYGKGMEHGVYCRLQAIVFTECCLSIGLPARTLHCLPFSPYDFESHVVSMVYINEMEKWVLFDASNNAYFMDEHGMPLSPLEARHLLALNACHVNDDLQVSFDYKRYMAKNLFYFKFSAKNTFGTDLVESQQTYHLIPSGFDAKTREVAYCEYAMANCPPLFRDEWVQHLEAFKAQEICAVSAAQFLRLK